jgi:hypothetical protein
MSGKKEVSKPTPPKESYLHEHGFHRLSFSTGEMVTAISAQTWSEYLSHLKRINAQDKLVVSPELMTFTGRPLREVGQTKQIIKGRINQVETFSLQYPNTTFILGTPTFNTSRPRNSVLFIKQGKIVAQTHKRSGATQEEQDVFDLPVHEKPSSIPDTDIGILICSDLAMASFLSRPHFNDKFLNQTLKTAGQASFINTQPTFLHSQTKKLIIPSCWGVGGNKKLMTTREVNKYYQVQLRNLSWALFNSSKIEEIIMVDRTIVSSPRSKSSNATKPLNGLIQKHI